MHARQRALAAPAALQILIHVGFILQGLFSASQGHTEQDCNDSLIQGENLRDNYRYG